MVWDKLSAANGFHQINLWPKPDDTHMKAKKTSDKTKLKKTALKVSDLKPSKNPKGGTANNFKSKLK